MEDILERTRLVRPKCTSNSSNAGSRLKDYSPQRSKTVSSSTNVSPTTNQSVNTYKNLQPPPKPSFNHATSLQLLTVEEQNLAPPKPSLKPPQSEGLDSLIYSTLKEFRPTVEQVKSDPPREEVNQSLNSSTGSKKFTVTPVSSGGSPTATTFVESFSSRSSNDDVQSKIAAPQEPLKYITVPEDLVNLDRRSILRARFRKSMEYAKHALGFIISHIGLSLMVVGYTILGALVFCAVERERERQVKTQMLVRFNNTLTELMDLWIASYFNLRNKIDLIHRAAMTNQTLAIHAQGKHGLEGLDWYLHGLELSKEIIPRHWIEGIVSENSSSTFQDLINSTTTSPTSQNLFTATAPNNIASFATVRNGTSYPSNYDSDYRYIMETLFNGSSNADQISNITFLAESVRANVTRIIATYVNQVVHAIKDEGWNGASNFDDINWTFEGGVLFAITVITTIGYGHVTPQTQYGKLLTMLYAVIGIPLFFIYLSKNGDMMASLFRLAYARGCKPVFRMISRRRSRNATKNGLYNSMQSLALIANLDATVMRLHHKDSTNSNDSTDLDRNLSIHSTKTTHSEGSPPADASKKTKSIRSYGKSKGKVPRPLKRSVSTKSFRDLRRNAVAELGGRQVTENDNMLTIVPGGKLIIPQSSSLDSYNRPYKKFLSSENENISTSNSGINNGPSHNGVKRKLIIHNVPKPSSDDKTVNVPISLTLCMMFIYILIGATVFCMWENPDYIKWSYFCFVTLSTIGFGDIVPGTKIDSENPKEKMITLVFYVAIGLSFFAMCFKLMQEEAMNKLRRIGQRMGILKRPEEGQAANLIETTDTNPLLPSDGAAAIIVTTNTSANTSRSLGHRSAL